MAADATRCLAVCRWSLLSFSPDTPNPVYPIRLLHRSTAHSGVPNTFFRAVESLKIVPNTLSRPVECSPRCSPYTLATGQPLKKCSPYTLATGRPLKKCIPYTLTTGQPLKKSVPLSVPVRISDAGDGGAQRTRQRQPRWAMMSIRMIFEARRLCLHPI